MEIPFARLTLRDAFKNTIDIAQVRVGKPLSLPRARKLEPVQQFAALGVAEKGPPVLAAWTKVTSGVAFKVRGERPGAVRARHFGALRRAVLTFSESGMLEGLG